MSETIKKIADTQAYNMGVIAGCCQEIMKARLGDDYADSKYPRLVAGAPSNAGYFAALLEAKSLNGDFVDSKLSSRVAELCGAAIKAIGDTPPNEFFRYVGPLENAYYWVGVNAAEGMIVV